MSSRKTVLALYLVQFAQYLAPLVTLPYLARVLGPQNFGKLGFAQALVQFFMLVTEFGFNMTVTRQVAVARDDPRQISKLYWNTGFAQTLLALPCMLAMIALGGIPSFRADFDVICIASTTMIGAVLTPLWLYHGLNRLIEVGRVTLFVRGIGVVLTFAFVRSSDDYVAAALIQFVLPCLIGVILTARVHRERLVERNPRRVELGAALAIVRDGFDVFSGSALTSVFTYGNAIVLKFVAGDLEVGLYTASEKLLTPLRQVYGPPVQAYFPKLCDLYARGDLAGARVLLRKVASLFAVFGVSAIAGVWTFGPWLLPLLFGGKYAGSVGVAAIQVVTQVIASGAMIETTLILIAAGRQSWMKWIYLAAALLHATYTLPLVHTYRAAGTALSALATELIVVGLFALLILRARVLRPEPASHRGSRDCTAAA